MTDVGWATHEPPWLARTHPDVELGDAIDALADDVHRPQPLTAEQRAARLVEQLERAAAGRIPPALAGPGWREATPADPDPDAAPPRIVERSVGPWPCQLAEPIACPDCGREFHTRLTLAVHAVDHRTTNPGTPSSPHWTRENRSGATKPKPGARTKKRKRK